MSSPRGSYGGGYGGYYPSSSSFPDTPIYDSLVAERGTPQIAPIRVPSPYSPYETGGGYNGYSGSNLPALPALPALPSGPSAPAPQYTQPQQSVPNGYPAPGYQQPPAPYIPQQAAAPRGGYNGAAAGYNGGASGNGFGTNGGGFNSNGGGYPAQPPQPSPSGYEAARPVPPRPVPPRQTPGGHPDDQYPRRNLGQGYYQG